MSEKSEKRLIKIIKSDFVRYVNGFIAISMLVIFALEVESLFHNWRILNTIFHDIINIVYQMHDEDYKNLLNNGTNLTQYSGPLTYPMYLQTQLTNTSIDKKDPFHYEICKSCNQNSIKITSVFNIYGLLLSLFLSIISFSYAYQYDLIWNYNKVFIPVGFLGIGSVFAYFGAILSVKPVKKINFNAFIFQLSLVYLFINTFKPRDCAYVLSQCDADFDYHFRAKMIPLSAIMLICVPQILIRIGILIYMIRQNKMKQISETNSNNNNNNNNNDNASNCDDIEFGRAIPNIIQEIACEMEPMEPIEKRTSFYREVPVDCVEEQSDEDKQHRRSISLNSILMNIDKDDKIQIDYIISNNNELFDEEALRFVNMNLENSNFPFNRRAYVKVSSLSTISEEKSLKSFENPPSRNSMYKSTDTKLTLPSYDENNMQVINSLLEEIHDKTWIMNELMHVFEPSSKQGLFRRNIPIRMSSKPKYDELINNSSFSCSLFSAFSSSSSLNSKFSPISYNKASSRPSIENANTSKEHLAAGNSRSNVSNVYNIIISGRKSRLLKRMKNHLENMKGKSFTSKHFENKNNVEIDAEYNPDVENFPIEFNKEHETLEIMNKGNNEKYEHEEKHSDTEKSHIEILIEERNGTHRIISSKLLIKPNVKPVYF